MSCKIKLTFLLLRMTYRKFLITSFLCSSNLKNSCNSNKVNFTLASVLRTCNWYLATLRAKDAHIRSTVSHYTKLSLTASNFYQIEEICLPLNFLGAFRVPNMGSTIKNCFKLGLPPCNKRIILYKAHGTLCRCTRVKRR